MSTKLAKRIAIRIATVMPLFVLVFLFQNCGNTEQNLDQALTDYENSVADSLPFAFDFSIDHIAYMSCEDENLDSSQTFFNFKAGAYNDDEGLRFSDSFFESIGALSTNKSKLISYLQSSERNTGAGVVMSVRESGSLRSPVVVQGSSFENSVSPMLWDLNKNVQLTQEDIASNLYDNPGGVNYLKGFPGVVGKSFESELSYRGFAQNVIRNTLEGSGYLSFTFGTSDLEMPGVLPRSPHDPSGQDSKADSSVFGKGYKLSFRQYDSGRLSSPRVVLNGVTGFELQNDSVSLDETWVCPENERYVIIKDAADAMRRYDNPSDKSDSNKPWMATYDDGGLARGGYYIDTLKLDRYDENGNGNDTESIRLRHKVLCPMIPDEMVPGQSEHIDPAWKRIRNILPEDEWYVFRGPKYNCIVPKRNDFACYGKINQSAGNSNQPILQYFPDEDFVDQQLENHKIEQETGNPAPILPQVVDCEASSGNGSNRYCPHVLSICYKL